MALDPKKFALLTSTIAASIVVVGTTVTGCTEKAVDDTPGEGSSSGEPTSSSSSSSGDGGGSSSGDGGGSSSSSSSGDGGNDAGSCLGDDGAAPSCDDIAETCLAEEDREYTCPGYATIFRPAIARATIDCLKISPSCEEGDPDLNNCAAAAIAEGCPVDVVDYCDELIVHASCGDSDVSEELRALCLDFAPALSEAGKTALTDCAKAEDSCAFELRWCLEPSYAAGSLSPYLPE